MVAKHSHVERHFGVHPLTQSPPWASELTNPNYPYPNSAGTQLKDVTDPTDPQDAATKAYVDGLRSGRITGDSSTFEGGIGDWVATHGSITLTDETTAAWAFTGQHHAKIVAGGTSGQGAKLPLDGTFYAGVRYAALFVIKGAGADNTQIEFGDFGSGDFVYAEISASDDYLGHVIYWTAADDTTAAELRAVAVFGTGGYEIDIIWAQAARADALEDLFLGLARIPSDTASDDPAQSPALILRGNRIGQASGVALEFTGQDLLKIEGRNHNAEIWINDDATGSLLAIAGAGGTPADQSGEGFEVDVGPDEVQVFLSEKDSSTAQLYAGSGYVLEIAGDVTIDCGGAP